MLYAAMLDGEQWLEASALIEEACGSVGSGLLIVDSLGDDLGEDSIFLQARGERQVELERDYLEHHYRTDERIHRCRALPYDQVTPVVDLYTEEERKSSLAYNDFLKRAGSQQGVTVRLRGFPGCSHIAWALADPVGPGDCGSAQIAMIERFLPHIRQFVGVRRALAASGALGASLNGMLDNPRIGVIHLDRSGRIVAANDRAVEILRCGSGLTDRSGFLHARLPAHDARLARLLAAALAPQGGAAEAGAMTLRCPPPSPQLVVHVKPTAAAENHFGGQRVAALVLVVEPGRQSHFAPAVVGSALGLTPAETQVAVWIAEGRTVREIAEGTGRKESSIYWHLRQIYDKLGISRQADLVRLVLSLSDFV